MRRSGQVLTLITCTGCSLMCPVMCDMARYLRLFMSSVSGCNVLTHLCLFPSKAGSAYHVVGNAFHIVQIFHLVVNAFDHSHTDFILYNIVMCCPLSVYIYMSQSLK